MHIKLWSGTAMATTTVQIPVSNSSSEFQNRTYTVLHTLPVTNSHKTVWLDAEMLYITNRMQILPKEWIFQDLIQTSPIHFCDQLSHTAEKCTSAHPPSQVVFKALVFSGIPSYPQGRQGKSRTNEMFKPLMTRGGGHLVSHLTHATQGKLLHFLWYNSFQKFGALSFQIRELHVMKTDRSTNYRTFIGSVSQAITALLYSTQYLESD